MNEFSIKEKRKMMAAFLLFIAVVTIYFGAKFLNEVKLGRYIGAGITATNTIAVAGKGEVYATPDIAMISFTIREEAKTSDEAKSMMATKEKKALDFLRGAKIEEKDIKTLYTSVNPKYEYQKIYCITVPCPDGRSTIVGYEAFESIEVKVRVTDKAGDIMSGITAVGVGEVSGPNFQIDDMEKVNADARAKAITDAKEKATLLAGQLGVKLVRIVSFSENGNYPMYYARGMAMDAGAPKSESAPAPELPTGENKITSNVTITYEIR